MSTSAETPPDSRTESVESTGPTASTEPAEFAPAAAAFLPGGPLRIARGHAGPEELAALTVILCARLAHLNVAAGTGEPEQPGASHRPAVTRPACWSGCWACG